MSKVAFVSSSLRSHDNVEALENLLTETGHQIVWLAEQVTEGPHRLFSAFMEAGTPQDAAIVITDNILDTQIAGAMRLACLGAVAATAGHAALAEFMTNGVPAAFGMDSLLSTLKLRV